MPTPETPIPEPISELHAKLEQFRATRPARTRLPESLWQEAADLARCHGIYVVARSLRLDYNTLKKHVKGSSAGCRPRRKRAQPRFVELVGAPGARGDEYIIELETRRGSKVRIHCKNSGPPDWEGLLQAWQRVER